MHLSNISLAYLLLEVKGVVEGSIVRKVQELKEKSGFKLKLQTRMGSKDLVLTPDFFFISSHTLPVDEKPGNFCLRLKKFLLNKKVLSFSQHGFERIIAIKFEETSLILELFAQGNIILADRENKIIEVLKHYESAARTLKRNAVYSFPEQKGMNPLEASMEALSEKFTASKKDALGELLSSLNSSKEICTEILFLCGVDPKSNASSLSSVHVEKIVNQARQIYSVSKEKFLPHTAENTIIPFAFDTVANAKKIDSINGYFDRQFSAGLESELVQKDSQLQNLEKKKLEINREKQLLAKTRLEEMQKTASEKAEKIYLHYEELQAILSAVNSLEKQKKPKEEILASLGAIVGEQLVKKIVSLDLKKKEIELEL